MIESPRVIKSLLLRRFTVCVTLNPALRPSCHSEDRRDEESGEVAVTTSAVPSPQTLRYAQGDTGKETLETWSLRRLRVLLTGLAILVVLALMACGGPALPPANPTPDTSPTMAAAPETEAPQLAPHAENSTGPSVVRLEFAEGTEAAYLVNEQLARMNLPQDAIGTTDAVSGVILLGADNQVPEEGSELRVDLSTLISDSDRRDRYVRRNTLSTVVYPFAVFIPREVQGLPSPLPTQGEATFQMAGDMTIHGVTSDLVWDVTATFARDQITGQATTEFPFDKFGMTRPKVRLVLSVEDRIRLRIDFRLLKVAG